MIGFDEMRDRAARSGSSRTAVIYPHDHDTLEAVHAAQESGLSTPLLIGDREIISSGLTGIGGSPDRFTIVQAGSPGQAAETALHMILEGRADAVMKGLIDTSVVLKAVLKPEFGMRTGRLLSHVAVLEIPEYPRLLFITDAAMNIAPSLEQKLEILENAVEAAHALGLDSPRVAVVCAKEKVDPRMPATVDAGEIVELYRSGRITGCSVGGPFGLDNAVSTDSAMRKGITDPIAGHADILLLPTIEAANALYKSLIFLSGSTSAGIIAGARVPVVLTSRADSTESKLNSIAFASLYAANLRKGR